MARQAKAKLDFEAWQASAEGIAYRLPSWGINDKTRRTVIETLQRLPDDVREFALGHCVFLSVNLGATVPGSVGIPPDEGQTEDVWLILLHEGVEPEDAHGVVAHEIAHAFLGHDFFSEDCEGADFETPAARQAREWGFSGMDTVEPDLNPSSSLTD